MPLRVTNTPIDEQALTVYEKVLGPIHTSTLDAIYNLGILCKDLGRLGDAEKMYQPALTRHEKALGTRHVSTLDTAYWLGSFYSGKAGLLILRRCISLLSKSTKKRGRTYSQFHS